MKHLRTRLDRVEEKLLSKKPEQPELERLIEGAKEGSLTPKEHEKLTILLDIFYHIGVIPPPNEFMKQIKNGLPLDSIKPKLGEFFKGGKSKSKEF